MLSSTALLSYKRPIAKLPTQRLEEQWDAARLLQRREKVFYWREGNYEVDFVVQAGRSITAIEVKSGRARETLPGMDAFSTAFKPTLKLLVGVDGISIGEFLMKPVEEWVKL